MKKEISKIDAIEVIEKLWQIIDDIDTIGDIARDNDDVFRKKVELKQKERWNLPITTDGYALNLSNINFKKFKRIIMKKEHTLRAKAINLALKTGHYAFCPYGFNRKFIWDWSQDCLIYIDENINVPELEIMSSDFSKYHNDINEFICDKSSDKQITKKITLYILHDFIYGFCTENGTVFTHKNWRGIDWEKTGF